MAYQCVMPACPATHESKWQVCTTDESLQHQLTVARDLLRACAIALRDQIDACAECDWGSGSTGYTLDGEVACECCGPRRDLLKRVEAVT